MQWSWIVGWFENCGVSNPTQCEHQLRDRGTFGLTRFWARNITQRVKWWAAETYENIFKRLRINLDSLRCEAVSSSRYQEPIIATLMPHFLFSGRSCTKQPLFADPRFMSRVIRLQVTKYNGTFKININVQWTLFRAVRGKRTLENRVGINCASKLRNTNTKTLIIIGNSNFERTFLPQKCPCGPKYFYK